MIFTPAQAVDQNPDIISIPTYNQESSSVVAQENQAAIASLLNKLPDSPELDPLRAELNNLYSELALAQNDAEADLALDRSVEAVRDRFIDNPNVGQIREILMDLREAEYEKLSEDLSSLLFPQQTPSSLNLLQSQGSRWGWLS
ncbi:hypothetical protein J0895_21575 [Phormidium pseudopriestleyi FRX01]|uniref:Uncharacterized protein n=1 Tax=Phormidium pseudopriestleyi FRX01 TaxID=1759528 RepID=A0ABS3FWZ6_9CYAN|nr:hypothetical protein [Phormidium pseudopriestleyi]MBO0351625.1 hypothetical protein [Phormidium pseudopriestleyi FRX01]